MNSRNIDTHSPVDEIPPLTWIVIRQGYYDGGIMICCFQIHEIFSIWSRVLGVLIVNLDRWMYTNLYEE